MTETYYYFDGVNHTEETESEVHRILMAKDGYLEGSGSELAVIQNTPAAMNVVVGTGKAWVAGGEYINSAAKTVTVDAADSSYSRIDLVVIRITWATNEAIAAIHKGTAAASPVAPTPTQSTAVEELPLAILTIPAGTTAITAAMISDARASLYGTNLQFVIEGGGAVIAAGSKGYIQVPFNCTIKGWTLLAAQSGSIVIDIRKSTHAAFPPTASICASAKPALSAVQKGTSTTLTGWTAAITKKDILELYVDSCTSITRITVVLDVTR